MAGVSGMLGLAGGASGTGFAGPGQANIQTPVTTAQANAAQQASLNAIAQQQAFLNQVQAQGGLGNQTNVYNQLANIAAGQGPNPAQAQLAQATGANTANQAALMAGQRGANANVGLMARQAAQQGAQNQQQAAGQAATLQANQSLNALQGMGGLANTMAAQQAAATGAVTGANQTQQANLLNSLAGQNNAIVGSQSSVNSANAALAQAGMAQQTNMLGNIMNGAGTAMQLLADGGQVDVPSTTSFETPQQSQFTYNQDFQADQSAGKGSSGGGGAKGLMSLAALMADGGQVPADPNQPITPAAPTTPQASGPKSKVAKFFAGMAGSGQGGGTTQNAFASGQAGASLGKGIAHLFGAGNASGNAAPTPSSSDQWAAMMGAPGTRDSSGMPTDQATYDIYKTMGDNPNSQGVQPDQTSSEDDIANSSGSTQERNADNDNGTFTAAKGGKVPALLSPGERYLTPEKVNKVVKGKADPINDGKLVPGKPKVDGAVNSYKNDTVKASLDEGGIVIPRSITEGKNPHWEAMKFVHKTMAKGGKLPKKVK